MKPTTTKETYSLGASITATIETDHELKTSTTRWFIQGNHGSETFKTKASAIRRVEELAAEVAAILEDN